MSSPLRALCNKWIRSCDALHQTCCAPRQNQKVSLPALSLNEDEVFARLLIELGHIIGITHAPDSALSMIGLMTDAVLQGQQAAQETGSPDSETPSPPHDDTERLPDWAAQCSPVRH